MSEIHSLVGPYITDALDGDERDSFELHLKSCKACRTEVLDLQETMSEVSALHEISPPPALRASILGAIAATPMLPVEKSLIAREPQPAVQATTDVETPSNVVTPDFTRNARPVTTWLAAAAAVIAVALGGVTVLQQSELQTFEAANAQRVELLASPDLQVTRTALADGTDLTYLVSQSLGEALISTTGLPSPGDDRSWQVWVVQDDTPRSVAVLDEGGQLQVSVEDVSGGQAMAITNEPQGGSPQPTGDLEAAIELQAT